MSTHGRAAHPPRPAGRSGRRGSRYPAANGRGMRSTRDAMRSRRLRPGGPYARAALITSLLLAGLPASSVAHTRIDGVDIELPRGMRIEGTITGPGGAPVAGAFVSACAPDFCGRGDTTEPDGSYSIRGLWPDGYLVSVGP